MNVSISKKLAKLSNDISFRRIAAIIFTQLPFAIRGLLTPPYIIVDVGHATSL